MKNTLILILTSLFVVSSMSASDGWGQKQTQRTVGGAISGATIGGIIGHQQGKQKEGIIIGSVLGMIIGNKSGKGHDVREERQRQEQIAREQAHQRELQRRELERQRQYRMQQMRTTNSNNSVHSTDELTQARHRAEQREAQLHREMEILRIQQERRRALEEYRQREIRAQEQLERIRNGESVHFESHGNIGHHHDVASSPVHY